MTHDELLKEIERRYWKMFNHNFQDQTKTGVEHRILIQKQYFSLRAVVELHKAQEITLPNGEWGSNCIICDGWSYPCPTIQAIEKELG